jgi:hypothetical protein
MRDLRGNSDQPRLKKHSFPALGDPSAFGFRDDRQYRVKRGKRRAVPEFIDWKNDRGGSPLSKKKRAAHQPPSLFSNQNLTNLQIYNNPKNLFIGHAEFILKFLHHFLFFTNPVFQIFSTYHGKFL